MDITRILRHLLTTHWQVKRAFAKNVLLTIEKTIKTCEMEHGGEICFAIEGALPSTALFNGQSARERAIEVFSQLRTWDTEHNNGVLIYVLLADRDVEIVADRGAHVKVSSQEWQAICNKMEAAFCRGKYCEGATKGIQDVARHLQQHFPTNGPSHNELPDTPVVL